MIVNDNFFKNCIHLIKNILENSMSVQPKDSRECQKYKNTRNISKSLKAGFIWGDSIPWGSVGRPSRKTRHKIWLIRYLGEVPWLFSGLGALRKYEQLYDQLS